MADGTLVPRVYQDKAAERAIEENVIMRADTGSGKTFVAVLLIRSVLARPTTPDRKQLVVFTTPTTTLVMQQAHVIATQTTARVKAFLGAEVDFWKRERFEEELANADVLVCVPQIWLNILNSGYYKLRDCALLVVDECHHCRKKDPSAEVMRQHYHPKKFVDPDGVPKIFGMTASPLWNVKNPQKAISDFEALLDARILEVQSMHADEIRKYTPKAVGSVVQYDCAGGDPFFDSPGHLNVDALAEQAAHVSRAAQSPRVEALLRLLRAYEGQEDFHAIIFVQERAHTKLLSRILEADETLHGWLRPAALTGHGSKARTEPDAAERARQMGMEVKEQQAIVAQFRTGALNVLVATSIAEEGLDFRACNLVVRFDALMTVTGYIQSRGRARAAEARYVVLALRGSPEALKYDEFVEQEKQLHKLLEERGTDSGKLGEPELDDLPTYATSAGALLTHPSAIPVLAGFCQHLKTDEFTPIQKPQFVVSGSTLDWSATLRVPKTAALDDHVFTSMPLPTQRAAKQNAAYQACLALHAAGALDDHLQPVRPTRTDNARDADGRLLDRARIPSLVQVELENPFGDMWAAPEALVYTFEIASAPPQRLALVCGATADLPSVPEMDGVLGEPFEVRVSSVDTIVWADPTEREERLAALQLFNRQMFRIVLNRRSGDERLYALWAPVAASGQIDWATVANPFPPADPATLSEGDLLVLPLRRPAVRMGYFAGVRDDVTTASPTREVEFEAGQIEPGKIKKKLIEKFPNFMHFIRVLFGEEAADVQESEPIARLDGIALRSFPALKSVRYEDGQVGASSSRLGVRPRQLPLSLLRAPAFDLDFFRTWLLVPSLNRYFIEHSISRSLAIAHGCPGADRRLLAQALTPPASGTGYDYESLEFVGDAVLQICTSVHIFLQYPHVDEEYLTTIRSNSVDNRFLRRLAIDSGFTRYLLPYELRSTNFVPETKDDELVSGDKTTVTKVVGRRVLSDTLEAVLGVIALSESMEAALRVGDRLGFCFGGSDPWHVRPAARTFVEEAHGPAGPGLRQLEAALGYTFRTQGNLLQVALTHRSWVGSTACYERLEFLGDALLEWWTTDRLYTLDRTASPSHLTFARAILVSSGTLALIGLRKLDLPKVILHSSPALQEAVLEASEEAESFKWQQVMTGDLTFLWSPPKVISDVVEAILAAVFIDAGFQLEPVMRVLDKLYSEIMECVDLSTRVRDPYSRFLMLRDGIGCKYLAVKTTFAEGVDKRPGNHTAICTFHDGEVLATVTAPAKTVARQLACKAALRIEQSALQDRCTCRASTASTPATTENSSPEDSTMDDLEAEE